MAEISRRRLLAAGAGTAAAASLPLHLLRPRTAGASREEATSGASPRPSTDTWEGRYRAKWRWDRVAKATHGWLNCRSACAWDLYIVDGVIVREEQTATYEASADDVPDFNPRGCQKGACFTEVMYGPSRLTVPLKRVGPRGSGRWRQISWEQAIQEIAAKLLEVIERHGTEAIVHDLGPHFDHGATTVARVRFFGLLGATLLDSWAEIGDLNVGATLTFGFPHIGGTADEWFESDYLVVWMMNPSVTQMPDAHFLYEARYNGAELVTIDPIYSATTIHADQWLPIRPGTDAALALGLAREIFARDAVDLPYVREQTDLPLLVRTDTRRFLEAHELGLVEESGHFVMWDTAAHRFVVAPGSRYGKISLLEGVEPAISGRYQATLADGTRTEVVPVGTLLRERLERWAIPTVAEVTGLHPEAIRRFYDGFIAAERPMILSSWGSNRYFHSDLMNRAKILCLSLRGKIGVPGAGYHATGWFGMEGFEASTNMPYAGHLGLAVQLLRNPNLFEDAIALVTRRKTLADLGRDFAHNEMMAGICTTNNSSLNYRHMGIADAVEHEVDPLYPRPFSAYVDEAERRWWMPVRPKPPKEPKVWFTGGNNLLRRSNLPQRTLAELWPKLELIVDVNFKLTSTGIHADYLLPAAGYYEKPNIKYPVAYVPYLHYGDAAVPPLGESKDEWEIFTLLARELARQARAKGLREVPRCPEGNTLRLDTFDELFTFGGKFGPKDAEGVTQQVLDLSMACAGMEVRDLKRTGIAKFRRSGPTLPQSQLYNTDWEGEGVLRALTHFIKHKWRWPTRTGRQQFYIDHPWFLEADEALPTHKESPKAGGDHPFRFVSCHARWSIHSVWRDTPLLLRLQRGEPVVYVNPEDLAAVGLADGAWAELGNRYGRMRMRVKAAPMVPRGVLYYFHAWEPFQFPEHKSYKHLIPGLIKPLHYAGGYDYEPHLGFRFAIWEPGQHVQDTRVWLRPWKEAS